MSTDVTKVQVFRATKVRTSLKGDGSWIRGSPDANESLDKLRKPEIPKKPDIQCSASPVTSPTCMTKNPLTSVLKRSVSPPASPSVKKTQSNPVTSLEETTAKTQNAELMSEPAIKTTVANKEVVPLMAVDPPKDEMGPVDSEVSPMEDHNGATSSGLETDQSSKAEAKATADVPVGLENTSIEEKTAKATIESELKEPVKAKEEPTMVTVTPMLAETEMHSSHAVELAAGAATEPAVHAVEVKLESSEGLAAEGAPIAPAETPKPIIKAVQEADAEPVIVSADKVTVPDDIVEAASEPIVEAIDKAAVEVAVKTAVAEDVEPTAEVIVEPVVQTAVKATAAAVAIQPSAEGAIDHTDKAAVDDAVKCPDAIQPIDEVVYEAEEDKAVGDVVKDIVITAAAADVIQPADEVIHEVKEETVGDLNKDTVITAAAADAIQPADEVIYEAEEITVVEEVVKDAVVTATAADVFQPADEVIYEAEEMMAVEDVVKDAVVTAAAADAIQPADEVIYEAEDKTVVGDVVKDDVKTATAAEDVQPVDEAIYEAEEETPVVEIVNAVKTAAAADDVIQPIVEPIVEAADETVVENVVSEAATTTEAQDFAQPSAKPITEAVNQTVVEAVDKDAVKPAATEDVAQPAGKPFVETVDKTAVENVVEVAVKTAAASEDADRSGAKVIIEAVAEVPGLESSINTSVKHATETPQHVPSSFEPKIEPAVETDDNAIVEIPVGVNCSDEPVTATVVAVAQHAIGSDAENSENADKVVLENPEPNKSVVEPVAEAIHQDSIESEIKLVEEHVGEAMGTPSIQADKKVMMEIEPVVEEKEPAAEVVSETVTSTSQSTPCSMESQPNQQAETNSKTNSQDNVAELQTIQTQRQTLDGRAICSFCDQTIDGNIKITISEPPMYSHPECFKCGICTKALGDMQTTMFLHGQMVHCDNCFAKTL